MFLDEIVARLEQRGVGIVGSTLFMSSKAAIPAGSGPYLTVTETGGSSPSRTQNNTASQNPTAQILARGSSYPATRAMLQGAYEALGGANGLYNIVLSGTFYLSITTRQEPTDIGMDSAGRSMLSFNIDGAKGPS